MESYWKMGAFLASYVSYVTFEPSTFLIQSISEPIPPQIRLSCGVICKHHCGKLLVGQRFFWRDWGHPQKPTTIGAESKIGEIHGSLHRHFISCIFSLRRSSLHKQFWGMDQHLHPLNKPISFDFNWGAFKIHMKFTTLIGLYGSLKWHLKILM